MRSGSSVLSSGPQDRHPLQSTSEVTICRLRESLLNREESDIDSILQNKYNTEERKLIIIDRSKGKIIDSRFVNIDQEISHSLKKSFFLPAKPNEEEYVYEQISDGEHDPQFENM